MPTPAEAEHLRLDEDERRVRNWKRWGPYLSERQWGTVREDYSASGDPWNYFTHDQSRSRAYRWGEDGLLGITDRQCRLCFSVALWNGQDEILKERLFGLTGHEGNHGEDVKECYYYLDATPTASYLKALYKYPQRPFPYRGLLDGNARRGRDELELELADTGIFEGNRYFDVFVEYAKASPEDILIRLTVHNRGPEAAEVQLLPTLWFRNTWAWSRGGEGYWRKPSLRLGGHRVHAEHESLGNYAFEADSNDAPDWLFTENETNAERLFGSKSRTRYVKDAFHDYVVQGRADAVSPGAAGTKCAARYRLRLEAGESRTVRLRLRATTEEQSDAFGAGFEEVFAHRIAEANAFYEARSNGATPQEALVARQAYAGLVWSKQFYGYAVEQWMEGDPGAPPPQRVEPRNVGWEHLYNRDVLSMPDKWEYPWYAAWDLAFHMIPFAKIDPHFAKEQLVLLLREWYMHPNGQIPAYEFNFGDVNPPVHAWAAWRVYKLTAPRGKRDRTFLARVFNKLLLNFTWWVNRKDAAGNNLFAGGFLGLDNIGAFDRSKPLPTGGRLEQADGTAWMAFYCVTMLQMALELAQGDPAYEDLASKFFEHFVAITDAMNEFGGTGLWDEEDGFYYDRIHVGSANVPIRVRSMVGLIPLFTAFAIEHSAIERLPGFSRRMNWFLQNRPDLAKSISYMEERDRGGGLELRHLLAVPSRERLTRVLRYLLDEDEFLSPHGIRSLSKSHGAQPFVFNVGDSEYRVDYVPGESNSGLFGGNSNWRGPVWFPVNYLLVEALESYHYFYGDTLKVECPTGSGKWMDLKQVAEEIARRLTTPFLPDEQGRRPCHGDDTRYATDPAWKDLVLFYEHFHGETGRGIGASHQTGWTALVTRCIEMMLGAKS